MPTTTHETDDMRRIAAHYGEGSGEGKGALRYFARTGKIGDGLRAYLTDSRADPANMPPNLARLAEYVRKER